MLPVVAGGKRSKSGTNLRRLARQAGRPAAITALLLLIIAGTSLLLHNRISDAEEGEEGLHVVTSEPDEGGGSGGGRRQAQLSNEPPTAGGSVSSSPGAKEAVVGAAESRSSSPGTQPRKAAPSKFAQRIQQEREAAARAASGSATAGDRAAAAREARVAASMSFPPRPEPAVEELSDEEVARRREAVKAAMLHAWRGYEQYAWGHDELCPLTKSGKNSFGGLGATIVDSLDTLHMMGLKEEYERAAEWVRTSMPVNASFDASVFETIIRVVGGTLAAHDLTGDQVMLQRAQQVADRIVPAYATPTRIPLNIINLATQEAKNPTWNQKASTLAEFGTHQLEFWRLSQGTGNATYAELAEGSIRHLYRHWPDQGLMPLFLSPTTGNFTSRRISFGALGDSYYEYLLKMWIIKGRGDEMYRSMWEKAMDEMIDKLIFVSKDNLTYIAEYDRNMVKHKFDHLVCFVPGMLALGAHSGAVQGAKAERYIQLAADLTHTCWQMYHRMPTGLSAEYVTFTAGGLRVGAAFNLLRPEALEAMWYMWRITRDWRYRTWGWHIFQAFETHCKAEAGYAGLKDVRVSQPRQDDTMQSFFLAETLKYLWLLFSDDSAFNFDKWVLNTEAHPLRVSQPQGAAAAEQQQQQHKRWWWPPGRGGLAAGSGGAGGGVAQQRRS
ncbi:hypothetical protein ABPG77_005532 [Micractinium sp. CCAP 211/92]